MTGTLTPFKDGKYLPVEEALKQLKAYKPAIIENHPTVKVHDLEFSIEESEDMFTLNNVRHLGEIWDVDICKTYLNEGNSTIYSTWVDRTRGSDWQLPNTQLIHSCLKELFYHRGDLKAGYVKDILRPLFHEQIAFTGTHIRYMPDGNDIVIHDCGYNPERRISGHFRGTEAEIHSTENITSILDAVLGTKDLDEIVEIHDWAFHTRPHIRRQFSKPDRMTEYSVILYSNNIKMMIDCKRDPYHESKAIGFNARKVTGGRK